MPLFSNSILSLTILLAIGLIFFLRAASKDRTTIVDVYSPLPPLEVLNGISKWLELRGWKLEGGDIDRQVLRFYGNVTYSVPLAILLTILGGLGSACLGLVLTQIFPPLSWWPLLLVFLGGPGAGLIYKQRASRKELLELRLVESKDNKDSTIRLRAHRDELIAIEKELSNSLKLAIF